MKNNLLIFYKMLLIEANLWEAANKRRGSVEPDKYKHVVLGLIFLKFANDKFEEECGWVNSEEKRQCR